jgi:hypothetical protein
VGHGRDQSIDELKVWSVECDRALEMDELADLSCGCLGNSGVTAEMGISAWTTSPR